MKAIIVREFGPPDVMTLEDVPEPSPGAGHVMVRVKAVGVNPVDAYIRSGTYRRKPPLPYTPGMDYAGVVEAVGPGVAGFASGDRVYGHGVADGFGACAELTVSLAAQLAHLPARTSFQQGAALGVPYGTAWRALFMRARAKAGETVLVHGGSGGVGVAAIQMARARGMRVIATAGSDKGLALTRDQGADDVLDHREPDYLRRLATLTGGRGVDVVLEMLANVNLDRDLGVLAKDGRVVVIGSRGRVELDPRTLMGTDGSILGMLLFNTSEEDVREIHAGIVAGLEDGTLAPVIGREFPLAGAAQAHAAVMEPGAYGKIVLVP